MYVYVLLSPCCQVLLVASDSSAVTMGSVSVPNLSVIGSEATTVWTTQTSVTVTIEECTVSILYIIQYTLVVCLGLTSLLNF